MKARRVNLFPTDSMGSGAGKRCGAKHCCAKPCSWSHSHHCHQWSGRSSVLLGTRGARKDAGHEAMLPKPWGWKPLCQPAVSSAGNQLLWHELCWVLCPFTLLCTPAHPGCATETKSTLPGHPAPWHWGEAPSPGHHGAGWDGESLTLQHEARAQTPAQRHTEDGGGSPAEAGAS